MPDGSGLGGANVEVATVRTSDPLAARPSGTKALARATSTTRPGVVPLPASAT